MATRVLPMITSGVENLQKGHNLKYNIRQCKNDNRSVLKRKKDLFLHS
jgi:hypothetical protein